jgi:glycosyltransferase involved in cell wall biosynthesis
MKPVHIHMIKTYYPHWHEHTAFNAFLKYFDPLRFRISMRNVPIGEGRFPHIPFLKNYCREKIKNRGVPEYRLNDLAAEISIFFAGIFKRVDAVHFLDAEHSLMFLPYWYEKWSRSISFPKLVAMFHQPPALLESLMDIDIVRRVDRVVVVSPAQEVYFQQYLPAERITTILLGVDTQHFKPLPAKEKSGKFRCLGGGIWLRDYEAFFKTAELLRDVPGIEFHIVAPHTVLPGPQNPANIIFHENIPYPTLLELYQTCDVLFLPLKDATANTFLLEGSACGLPVVSTDIPAIKAYFPGEEAILIKSNDPGAFARVLTDLYNDPGQRDRRSACARERASALSWDRIVKEYEKMYREL